MRDFTLVGRQTSGTSVIGYMVMDNRTGKVQSVDKNTVYNLALNKRIEGVIAQEYMGRITRKVYILRLVPYLNMIKRVILLKTPK